MLRMNYLVVIIQIQDLAPTLIDLLVALTRSGHGQCRIHVHVMAGQVQTYKSLE